MADDYETSEELLEPKAKKYNPSGRISFTGGGAGISGRTIVFLIIGVLIVILVIFNRLKIMAFFSSLLSKIIALIFAFAFIVGILFLLMGVITGRSPGYLFGTMVRMLRIPGRRRYYRRGWFGRRGPRNRW